MIRVAATGTLDEASARKVATQAATACWIKFMPSCSWTIIKLRPYAPPAYGLARSEPGVGGTCLWAQPLCRWDFCHDQGHSVTAHPHQYTFGPRLRYLGTHGCMFAALFLSWYAVGAVSTP